MPYDLLFNAVIPDAYTRLVDFAWDRIKKLNEKEAIKALISDYLADEKKKHESQQGGVDYDFCFDSLPEVILNVIFDKAVLLNILSLDDTPREIEMKRIYNKCISDAGAKSEQSKHKITTIIDNCIYIETAYYVRKLTTADLVRDKRLVDGVNEHTDRRIEAQDTKLMSQFKEVKESIDNLKNGISSLDSKLDTANSTNSEITTNSTASSSATNRANIPASVHNRTISNTPNYAQNAGKLNDVLSWELSSDDLKVELAVLNELADALYDMPEETRRILAIIVKEAKWDELYSFSSDLGIVKLQLKSTANFPEHIRLLVSRGFISDFDPDNYCGPDTRSLYSLAEWKYWEDIKAFCKKTKTDLTSICVDVNFTVFDN